MKYIGIIHKEAGSDFGISFPDFPGCVTAGKSYEEALMEAREALIFHIDGMIEDGASLPIPSSINQVDLGDGAAIIVTVPHDIESKKVRVNISVDEVDLAEIDARAKASGLDRSRYLVKKALAG